MACSTRRGGDAPWRALKRAAARQDDARRDAAPVDPAVITEDLSRLNGRSARDVAVVRLATGQPTLRREPAMPVSPLLSCAEKQGRFDAAQTLAVGPISITTDFDADENRQIHIRVRDKVVPQLEAESICSPTICLPYLRGIISHAINIIAGYPLKLRVEAGA